MTIKQIGGVFGRNPTFNDVVVDDEITVNGSADINGNADISGTLSFPDLSIVGTGNAIYTNTTGAAFFRSSQMLFQNVAGTSGYATINSNGIVMPNGLGIDFSATSGTGTSELFDDYEEGTWTPSVGGNTTYTTQSGTYTKVGRQVVAHFAFIINTIGTGSTFEIAGLPFTSSNSGQVYVGYFGSLATAATSVAGYITATYSNINLVYATAATTTVVNAGNAIGSSTNISGVAVYFT